MNYLNSNNCYGESFLEGTKEFLIKLVGQVGDRQIILFRTDLNPTGISAENSLATYNFVKQAILANNLMIYEVEIRSTSNEQLLLPMSILNLDISGDANTTPLIPTFNPEQRITDRLRYNFIDNFGCPLILDGLTGLVVSQLAVTNLVLVFKYKQVMNKDLIYKAAFKEEYEKIKALEKIYNGISTFELKV